MPLLSLTTPLVLHARNINAANPHSRVVYKNIVRVCLSFSACSTLMCSSVVDYRYTYRIFNGIKSLERNLCA